jgi:TRAP transporter 4TM/12TM fusion protein
MRALSGRWDVVIQVMLGATAAYYLWRAAFGMSTLQEHRGIAVMFSLVAALLLYRGSRRAREDAPSLLDIILAIAAAVGVGYWIVEHEALAYRAGAFLPADFWMGVIVTVLSIEAARRVLGRPLAIVASMAILYALYGGLLPPPIGHRGFSLRRVVEYVYLTSDGIFGIMAEVLATFIVPFVVFGAFMLRAGVAKFFIDLAMATFGRIAGGPGQVAVVASGLLGSMNGSPIANSVTTGSITIPLMKRLGFPPHLAAAVEASASTGGMIMPPVMGAAAFIMAEMTGISYAKIATVSIIPGLLFFLSNGIMVYLEARKLGLRGLSPDELPRSGDVLRQRWYLFLPLVVLVGLLMSGFSPVRAVVYATLTTVAVSWLRKESRMGPVQIWQALVDGGRACAFVAAATGAVGIIVGIMALTGIGIQFSSLVLTLAGQNLPLALLLIAMASLVLGMGLPITAAYLVVAVVAAPTLSEMGVPLLAAHLIILWLSLDSNITPPVALGAYTTAAIAGADPWRTGWNSFRFAKLIYVMPVLFAYTHILWTGTIDQNLMAVVSATVGVVIFSIVSTAYLVARMTLVEFVLMVGATLLAFVPNPATVAAGAAIVAVVYLMQRRRQPTRVGLAAAVPSGGAR